MKKLLNDYSETYSINDVMYALDVINPNYDMYGNLIKRENRRVSISGFFVDAELLLEFGLLDDGSLQNRKITDSVGVITFLRFDEKTKLENKISSFLKINQHNKRNYRAFMLKIPNDSNYYFGSVMDFPECLLLLGATGSISFLANNIKFLYDGKKLVKVNDKNTPRLFFELREIGLMQEFGRKYLQEIVNKFNKPIKEVIESVNKLPNYRFGHHESLIAQNGLKNFESMIKSQTWLEDIEKEYFISRARLAKLQCYFTKVLI